MTYIEKKTNKRQTTIITLSDHNKQEIENISLERQIMEEEFDDKKRGNSNVPLADLRGFLFKESHRFLKGKALKVHD